MKKLLTALLLLTATLLPAQDFKLYFANNVTDVLDFNSIESTESGLQWREVKDKELAALTGDQCTITEIRIVRCPGGA